MEEEKEVKIEEKVEVKESKKEVKKEVKKEEKKIGKLEKTTYIFANIIKICFGTMIASLFLMFINERFGLLTELAFLVMIIVDVIELVLLAIAKGKKISVKSQFKITIIPIIIIALLALGSYFLLKIRPAPGLVI